MYPRNIWTVHTPSTLSLALGMDDPQTTSNMRQCFQKVGWGADPVRLRKSHIATARPGQANALQADGSVLRMAVFGGPSLPEREAKQNHGVFCQTASRSFFDPFALTVWGSQERIDAGSETRSRENLREGVMFFPAQRVWLEVEPGATNPWPR